jgi:hypothetical protein
MIGMPSRLATVEMLTMRSLMNDTMELAKRGDVFTFFDESGRTDIARARKEIVEAFREKDHDFLIFVDDDVFWEAGALLKLIDHPQDFVAGAYRKKTEKIDWPVGWIPDPEKKGLHAVNGLLEVAHAPGGFWCLSKACIEQMWANYGNTLFNRVEDANGVYSEDISFCGKWRAIGGKVWIDPEIKTGHVGKTTYTGSIGDWLRNR